MEPDEFTRRLWLLRLGSGVVLTGFSGLDLEAAAQSPLPPGLYQPSIDHLGRMTGLWFAMNPIGRREDSLLSSLRLISLMKMTTPEADSTSTSRWVNIREGVYWPPSPNLSHCHERPQAFPTLRQAANGRRLKACPKAILPAGCIACPART